MWMAGLLVLIALGLLGVASWLAARQPSMGGALKQLQGIEGWVGVVGLVWGLLGLSFLSKLKRFEYANGKLVLEQ